MVWVSTAGAGLVVASCSAPLKSPEELQVEPDSTVGTVLTASWETDVPARGRIRYGVVGEPARETPWEPEAVTDHRIEVRGLPANHEVELIGIDDTGHETPLWRGTTSGPPSDWPGFVVSETAASFEGWLLTSIAGATSGIALIDPQGRLCWWWKSGGAEVRSTRALMKFNKDGFYASLSPNSNEGNQEVVEVSWSGLVARRMDATGFYHDFLERPDGRLAAILQTPHGDEFGTCLGHGIAEFNFGEPLEAAWDSWDYFSAIDDTCPGGDSSLAHMNAIDYDPVRDEYTVGSRNFSTVVVVGADDFTMREAIGRAGTIKPTEMGDSTFHQHQFQWIEDDRLLLFDNGSTSIGRDTRIVEWEIDRAAGTFSAGWTHQPSPPINVYALGDVERLGNGNTLIDWTTSGMLQEVSPAGEVVWQLAMPLGYGFGYLQHVEQLYADEE